MIMVTQQKAISHPCDILLEVGEGVTGMDGLSTPKCHLSS